MDEFNGPKALIDQHGNSIPTQQYVDWLEARVADLTTQLATARSTIANLQDRRTPVLPPRRLAEDYADRYVENTEDLDDYYER